MIPYRQSADGALRGAGNDLASFKVYVRPQDAAAFTLGDLILLETSGARSPVSAFVGMGGTAPEGVVDLNNLFGTDLTSLSIYGGEKTVLSVYRGGALPTLLHYRTLPANSGLVSVEEPVKGFFADVNLDGKVDEQDFQAFKKQFRTSAGDAAFNPDFDFVAGTSGTVDAQDFARFAREYGKTGVQ